MLIKYSKWRPSLTCYNFLIYHPILIGLAADKGLYFKLMLPPVIKPIFRVQKCKRSDEKQSLQAPGQNSFRIRESKLLDRLLKSRYDFLGFFLLVISFYRLRYYKIRDDKFSMPKFAKGNN